MKYDKCTYHNSHIHFNPEKGGRMKEVNKPNEQCKDKGKDEGKGNKKNWILSLVFWVNAWVKGQRWEGRCSIWSDTQELQH